MSFAAHMNPREMPPQTHLVSKFAIVKGVWVAIKMCKDGHRREVFPKAFHGNVDSVAVVCFDLTYIDWG